MTREALEMGGYRVLEADGPAAAEHIAADGTTEIDLLLTDVVMPGMNGPELARQVCESRPDLVTLFMTGYAESEVLRLATKGSTQKHIQKPFTVSGLLSRVADALATRWHRGDGIQAPQDPSPNPPLRGPGRLTRQQTGRTCGAARPIVPPPII